MDETKTRPDYDDLADTVTATYRELRAHSRRMEALFQCIYALSMMFGLGVLAYVAINFRKVVMG